MTVQELVDFCIAQGISLDTQVAVRAKDDHLVVEEATYLDVPYFGNCNHGNEWMEQNAPKDEDGYVDYDKAPKFLILDTDS